MNCDIKGGNNDCHWNWNGRCTSFKVTRAKATGHTRDWDSKVNCTFTQIGVHICGAYMPEGAVDYAGQLVKAFTSGHVAGEKYGRKKLLEELIAHYEEVVRNGKGVTFYHPITYDWMYNGTVIDHLKRLRDGEEK